MRSRGITVRGISILLVIGVALFSAGLFLGYRLSAERESISGLINVTPLLSESTGTPEQKVTVPCLDKNGNPSTCLVSSPSLSTSTPGTADFSDYWKAWNIINERYVPTKHEPVSSQEKVWGSIAGLANSLGDPYTYFLPPTEKTIFEQDVAGAFGGVGMQIGMKDGLITVIAPLKDSPAERAGVRKGDRIIAINGATTTEMNIDKALYLIRGNVGEAVTIKLLREGREDLFDVSIVREVIEIPTIDTEVRDGVFVIRLYGFPGNGADTFRRALREFVNFGSEKLIVDLRGNPGGYLEVAVDMASWFLPEGKVIVSEADGNGEGRVFRSKGYNAFVHDFHFVILVDGGSASASEIFAGALSQHGVATLVGTKTFGKGSVQELIPIGKDTSLKLTIARWIMPNGLNLSLGGIDPDVVVEITKEDIDKGKDPQMEKAIELLKAGKFPVVKATTTSAGNILQNL